jgi:glycosyltransferase involved in cell wall biosynthesis
MSQLAASIVVCTRNRGELLRSTCQGVLDLAADRKAFELLIVDNGSTDETLSIARSLSAEEPDLVRLALEPRAGLSRARNTGVAVAQGEILAFLDDDAVPGPDWLISLLAIFEDPATWAAGGPVEPVYSGDLPSWLGEPFLPYLTVWDKGKEIQDLTYNDYPRGANVAYRRAAFQAYGPFSVQLGRQRRSLRSCEEIEMCLRLERGGKTVRYVPEARVRHRVDTSRLTPEWMERRFWAQGFSEALMEYAHAGLRGLAIGIRRSRRYARVRSRGQGLEAEILGRCHWRCHRGYFSGSLLAPLVMPRFRAQESMPLQAWAPFR